jgi:hypothetical protein
LLAGVEVDEALREQVRARLADLELLEKLQNVRLDMMGVEVGLFDNERTDGLYGDTFRDVGLDIEALLPQEAAERIRRSTVAAELASALDHWAMKRRRLRGPDDESWKHLLRIAGFADPDAWRNQVRDALEKRDGQALAGLAASDDVFRLLPSSLSVLVDALEEAGRTEQAVALLREARLRRPDDFHACFSLAHFLQSLQPPQIEGRFVSIREP